MASTPNDRSFTALRTLTRRRSGGIRGNELLTSSIAVLLIALLTAEGVTILNLRGLVEEHMLIGLVLIPPVLLKLSSVGYRFVRHYTGARAYTAKGAPRLGSPCACSRRSSSPRRSCSSRAGC